MTEQRRQSLTQEAIQKQRETAQVREQLPQVSTRLGELIRAHVPPPEFPGVTSYRQDSRGLDIVYGGLRVSETVLDSTLVIDGEEVGVTIKSSAYPHEYREQNVTYAIDMNDMPDLYVLQGDQGRIESKERIPEGKIVVGGHAHSRPAYSWSMSLEDTEKLNGLLDELSDPEVQHIPHEHYPTPPSYNSS